MTEPPVEPLSPDLEALLEREKLAYPEDAAMKAAVLARTTTVLALRGDPVPPDVGGPGGPRGGGAPGPAAASAAGAALSSKLGALAAVGVAAFVAGAMAGAVVTRRSPEPAPSANPSGVVPPAATSSEPSPSASAPVGSPAVSAAARPAASASAGPTPPAARGDLVRERELLDAAHAALSHGRPAEALASAERHAAQWPRGYLGEEREVVTIQALAALGRRGEAKQRADRYRQTHPKSLLLPAVDAVVPPG